MPELNSHIVTNIDLTRALSLNTRLRAEVNLHIAKLCASQMGLSFGVGAPNMGAVRFSGDPLPVNTDFQIVPK